MEGGRGLLSLAERAYRGEEILSRAEAKRIRTNLQQLSMHDEMGDSGFNLLRGDEIQEVHRQIEMYDLAQKKGQDNIPHLDMDRFWAQLQKPTKSERNKRKA